MQGLLTAGQWLLPLLYLGLVIDYATTFFARVRARARSPHLAAVLGIHVAVLVLWSLDHRRPPLATSVEILTVLALAIAAVYGVAEWIGRDRRTGVFVLLLAFLFQYTASYFLGVRESPPAHIESGVWARLHVLPAVVAYTALGLAAVYGALYLAARRELKRHRFGMLFDRLPPLERLGNMTWHVLLVGFVAITAAVVAGVVMARGEAMTAKIAVKIVTGGVAWLLYAAAVLGRGLAKWPLARVAGLALGGFAVVLALLVASMLLA